MKLLSVPKLLKCFMTYMYIQGHMYMSPYTVRLGMYYSTIALSQYSFSVMPKKAGDEATIQHCTIN